jgi:acetyl-CoA synthetase
VLHTTGGYLLFASMTHQYVFDYHDGDFYWCHLPDVGWVTVPQLHRLRPLANGATTLMFEGVPELPNRSRFWEVVDKHGVNIFYTAPTAIRALMGLGEEHVTKTSRKSLKLLGQWASRLIPRPGNGITGRRRRSLPGCRYLVADRDRRHLHHAVPGAIPQKPGSATLPFFGSSPA